MASARRLAANIFTGWFANVFKVVTQLVMLPLMAHLLGPEDIGLYALALPILQFVSLLSDGGLGDSLAREKDSTDPVWSSAFWGLVGSGIVLAVIVYGASWIIGGYAHQPQLPVIMLPLVSTLLMVAATVIPGAQMLRAGRSSFGAISDLIGYVIGAGVAIGMAFAGFGVWSMVAQYVLTFFIRMCLFNVFSPFRPRFVFSLKALISHWGIGGAILGGRLSDLGGRTAENSIISRVFGPASLGSYSYANQIPRFVTEAVSNPIWHNLYYLCLTDTAHRIPDHYVRHNRMIALAVFPAAALLAVALPQVVPLLLGARWVASIFPMAVLLVTYPFLALGNQTGAVLYARGSAFIPLAGTVVFSLARLIVLVFCAQIGFNGVALGLGAINLAYWLLLAIICQPKIGNRFFDLVMSLMGPFLASAVAAAGLFFMLKGQASLVWLIVCGLMASALYVGALFVVDRPRILTDMQSARDMLKKRTPAEANG